MSATHPQNLARSETPGSKKCDDERGDPIDGWWRLEPHVCRCCFGRLVSRAVNGPSSGMIGQSAVEPPREYHCPNCGHAATGHNASVACACGIQVHKGGRRGGKPVDAGIRCHENPEQRPDFPALYVASYCKT